MLAVAEPLTLAQAVLAYSASGRPALFDGDRVVSYAELVERVQRRVDELALPPRSLVALCGPNSLEWVVSYLALHAAGHVPLLVAEPSAEVTATWQQNATITSAGARFTIVRHHGRVHELHPELALLMSTSGSTGSPKLVRLSHRNVLSNARAIVDFQALTRDDRGISSLPLHYCFGLSVLHSHLVAGASVVITDASVVDPCFARAMREHGVTNLAGVPHTYHLLDRVEVNAPQLRLLTQAGGRLDPHRVVAWLDRAAALGAEFMVMYGQTEATARIAYLDPSIARRRPGAIGRPVPGSTMRLEGVGEDGVGEVVVRGDHVMMGYAEQPCDLERGHELDELATGDLARYDADDDVYEIVGRTSRFVKPFGLRINLDELERWLRAERSDPELVVAGDDQLIVVHADGGDRQQVERAVARKTGLPRGAIAAVTDHERPLTCSGKPDHPAILRLGRRERSCPTQATGDVAAMYAQVLGRATVLPDDTFVSLGGDSMSYVECAIRLERLLGTPPEHWHLMTIGDLAALAESSRHSVRRLARIDTTVLLRAIGICLVVCTHMRIWHLPGGAHTMLAIVGYNTARFIAPIDDTRGRVVAGLRTAARAGVPAVLWVAIGMLVFGAYSAGTLLLVNNYVGPASHRDDHWHFWFIEVFVHLVVLATLLLAIPKVRTFERRYQYAVPLAVLAAAVVLRLEWAQMDDWYNLRFRTHGVAWFFVLGWLIYQSSTLGRRVATTAVCLAVVPGFFAFPQRDWMIAAALVGLVWFRSVPLPRAVLRPIGVVAAASLWIYISHFTVWPLLTAVLPVGVGYIGTILAGIGVWFVVERLLGLLNTWRQGHPNPQFTPPVSPIGGVA